jgi:hypothetical protein
MPHPAVLMYEDVKTWVKVDVSKPSTAQQLVYLHHMTFLQVWSLSLLATAALAPSLT